MNSPLDPLALVGTLVGSKYLVETPVAEGGTSLVYRAIHTGWNQPCVLKFLKGLEGMEPEAQQRLEAALLREGAILRELSSRTASILQAHDVGTWLSPTGDPYPYLVLEWLEGAPLSTVFEQEAAAGRPPLSLLEVMALFDPVARALAAAHKRGIAHRDLKPDNLFLCGALRAEDSYLKVLDFGVAKILQDAGAMPQAATTSGASQSTFTPWYGAPEQFSAELGATGPWTDVFGLALVLVEAMTFQPALTGDDVMALATSAMHPSQRPTPRNRGVQVSTEVEAVFLRALSVRTEGRYPNVGEFWSELRRTLGLEPLEPPTLGSPNSLAPGWSAPPPAPPTVIPPNPVPLLPPSPSQPPPASAGSRWVWGIIGLSVLVLVGGSSMLLGMRMQGERRTPDAPVPLSSSAPVASVATPPPPSCPEGMARIPGGDFYMGFEGEGSLDFEKPQHPVHLSPFCIDITEVTVEQYRACSDAGQCLRAATAVSWPGITSLEKRVYGPLCNIDDAGRDRHPINCVDWEMADNYCQRRGKRLPTSAEWEFAVRGPDGRTYPWGDEPPDANHLNACGSECLDWARKNGVSADMTALHKQDDGYPTTAPVGSFPRGRSRYGLDDVIGNVMEWVHDWDGTYTKAASTDPQGPATGTERVIRGGAWNAGSMVWVRPSFRFQYPPKTQSHGIGFRCASPLASKPTP